MSHSTPRQAATKPEKPYDGFPLFPHSNGLWCKKVRGKLHYFGPWRDPDAALERWLDQRDDLMAGRRPRKKGDPDALTLADLVNRYLTAKKDAVASGEIVQSSFNNAHRSCAAMIGHFGRDRVVADLLPEDFTGYRAKLAASYAPSRVALEVSLVKAVLNWGFASRVLEKPVLTGPDFKALPEKAVRRLKAANGGNGPKMFEREEVLRLIDAAKTPLKAMVLLGINCGFGNNDCATLTQSAVDLEGGWIDHPRPKTGAERRCPLWPETLQSLREAIAARPEPQDPRHAELVFLCPPGVPWVRSRPDPKKEGVTLIHDSIRHVFRRLLESLDLHRPGRGFYALRHTHRTVSDEVCDAVAANYVMGHIDGSMAAHYRERIADERLERVADHVHAWLYGEEGGEV
ncbi:MAG: tyrosine-type recombinase/integrase [Thermoguttaceae bacterium]